MLNEDRTRSVCFSHQQFICFFFCVFFSFLPLFTTELATLVPRSLLLPLWWSLPKQSSMILYATAVQQCVKIRTKILNKSHYLVTLARKLIRNSSMPSKSFWPPCLWIQAWLSLTLLFIWNSFSELACHVTTNLSSPKRVEVLFAGVVVVVTVSVLIQQQLKIHSECK